MSPAMLIAMIFPSPSSSGWSHGAGRKKKPPSGTTAILSATLAPNKSRIVADDPSLRTDTKHVSRSRMRPGRPQSARGRRPVRLDSGRSPSSRKAWAYQFQRTPIPAGRSNIRSTTARPTIQNSFRHPSSRHRSDCTVLRTRHRKHGRPSRTREFQLDQSTARRADWRPAWQTRQHDWHCPRHCRAG